MSAVEAATAEPIDPRTDKRFKTRPGRVTSTPAKKLETNRLWRQANKERHRAMKLKTYQNQTPEQRKKYQLRNRYGIDLDQFSAMLKLQKFECAICANKIGDSFVTCVDHCHVTEAVRGVLCRRCNRALGLFADDIALMEKAIVYIKLAQARHLAGSQAWDEESDQPKTVEVHP